VTAPRANKISTSPRRLLGERERAETIKRRWQAVGVGPHGILEKRK
jgi:hypothetical protein